MKIGLHDSDYTGYPNLALMKLSAWHKKQGDIVSFFTPLEEYEKIYSSKVFTWSKDCYLPSTAITGGTGYKNYHGLPDYIEHICPDYSLYDIDYSMGFLTRGCPNSCTWCIVPRKEGNIKPHADIEEFAQHKKIVLMDNNILACNYGIKQIEKIIRLGLKVDFNQGLDAKLVDESIARLLSKIKWLHPLRLACDSESQIEAIQKAVTLLRWHNVSPRRYFVYILVRDIKDALERVRFLKAFDLDPFAQPYRDYDNQVAVTQDQKDFARWVNHKAIFKSVPWEEYKKFNQHMHLTCGKSPAGN